MHEVANVIIGPAELYVDGKNVGWTKGGVSLRVNKELWFRDSFDGMGVTEAIKEDESFYVATNFVEATLENFKIAMGLSESMSYPNPGVTRIDFGGSSDSVPTHTLKFTAVGRTAIFHKAVAVDFGEISHLRDSESLLPATFRLLIDTTKDIGEQLGYIMEGYTDAYRRIFCRVSVAVVTKDIVLRVKVRAQSSATLICQITIDVEWKNLIAGVTVLKASSSNIVCRVRKRIYQALATRLTVRQTSSFTLVNRLTVVYAAGTLNLVSRVTALKTDERSIKMSLTSLKATSTDVICRSTVRANSTSNLICRVTKTT